MKSHPDCYGCLFPDFTKLERNKPLDGQAFTALVVSQGIGVQGRQLKVKTDAWEQCLACTEYRTCYDLSMAKLHLNRELQSL